jgi:hypothetical protein
MQKKFNFLFRINFFTPLFKMALTNNMLTSKKTQIIINLTYQLHYNEPWEPRVDNIVGQF